MCVWRAVLWDDVSDRAGRSCCPPPTALSDLHLCHQQPRPHSVPVSTLVCRMCPVERSQEPSISSVLHSCLQDLGHTCVRGGQSPPGLQRGCAKVQREGRAIPLGQSRSHRRSLLLQEGPTRLEVTSPWGWVAAGASALIPWRLSSNSSVQCHCHPPPQPSDPNLKSKNDRPA